MNKKILTSVIAIAVVSGAAIGGTVAGYLKSASLIGATFTSENMDLNIDSDPSSAGQTWVTSFSAPYSPFQKVKPGSNGEQILDLENAGDVDGKVSIRFEQTDWSSLGDNLVFNIYYDQENDGFSDDTTPIVTGTVGTLLNNTYELGDMAHNSIASVKIEWNVPSTAGNDIMGKSITLNTVFDLNQIP